MVITTQNAHVARLADLNPVVLDFGTSLVANEEARARCASVSTAETSAGDGAGSVCDGLGTTKISSLHAATMSYLPVWNKLSPNGIPDPTVVQDACCPVESTDLFAFGALLYRFCLQVEMRTGTSDCCQRSIAESARDRPSEECATWLPQSYHSTIRRILGDSKCVWSPQENSGMGAFGCTNIGNLYAIHDDEIAEYFFD